MTTELEALPGIGKDVTEEETRQLHKVIIEIAQGQDRRGDQLVEAIARLEELKRAFAFLLE